MTRDEVSAITHGDLPFANPLDPAAIDAAVETVELPAGARVLDVELVCSDAAEHRRRVESRGGDRVPTWQDVVDRDYRPWDRERLVIDTARVSAPEAVRTIVAML
jgi:hypothetical protein